MQNLRFPSTLFAVFVLHWGVLSMAHAGLPMGSVAEMNYAASLWKAMRGARLVGTNSIEEEPFIGAARPHGWVLELHHQKLAVNGHTGFVVVKKNYTGGKPTIAQVVANRAKYLENITVMFMRENGYDDANQNWFWVKYKPDGGLFSKTIKGEKVAMAGRIFKGDSWETSGGCIFCHSSAGGGDFIFYPEIINPFRPVQD